MIGCKMGSSFVGVYITSMTSPMKTFKHGWKNNKVTNMATFLLGKFTERSSFLSNLEPSDKKLGLWRTAT
jgi:hypothetical protein